jgi:hypothetical protein
MATWLYQMNQKEWPPECYRVEVWEGKRCCFRKGRITRRSKGPEPQLGDTLVFFYAPSLGQDPGFYGWGVVLAWPKEEELIYFRPVSPSDWLKMDPWWDKEAKSLVDKIRGRAPQGTMWRVDDSLVPKLRDATAAWLQGRRHRRPRDHRQTKKT